MNGPANWSPMQKVLFTSLAPVATVVGALALFSVVRSHNGPAPEAQANVSQTAANPVEDARRQERDAFRNCLREMGADYSRTRYRSRFSPPPDMKKIQEATSVCRTLLGDGGGSPPAAPRAPATPPIA